MLPSSAARATRVEAPVMRPRSSCGRRVASLGMPPAASISSLERHRLKIRIWHVGNMLMKMHNCLQRGAASCWRRASRRRRSESKPLPSTRAEDAPCRLRGEFIALSPLLRKCFVRIKYILSDDINANVDENAILGQHDDDDSDSPPSPTEDGDAAPPAEATA